MSEVNRGQSKQSFAQIKSKLVSALIQSKLTFEAVEVLKILKIAVQKISLSCIERDLDQILVEASLVCHLFTN